MNKIMMAALMVAGFALGQSSAPKTAPAKKTKSNTVVTIPAGAVKDGNHYRYVDKKGKAWIYTETPFGVKKTAESDVNSTGSNTPFGEKKAESALAPVEPFSGLAPPQDATAEITAVRDGEVIHFQKPSPFGPSKWDKKVNELNPEEQKVWDREQAKRKQ